MNETRRKREKENERKRKAAAPPVSVRICEEMLKKKTLSEKSEEERKGLFIQ